MKLCYEGLCGLKLADGLSMRASAVSQCVCLLAQAEEFGRKLAHQFPWSPAAGVAVGLALRRRYQTHSGNPSTATHRKQIIKVNSRRCSQHPQCSVRCA